MSEIKFLLIDDDKEQSKILKEAIDEINKENSVLNLTFVAAKSPEEAMIALYKNYFQAVIIDLKLLPHDGFAKDDEELSGNILLKQIIEKEIIPIVVRTGFPEKVTSNINKNIVRVYPKEEPLYDIIKELIRAYNDSVFKVFGSRGEINKNIKELFWEVIPSCFSASNDDVTPLSLNKKETVIIRYISSWFANKYMFDDKYIDVEPIEMYMFPNPIQQVCTCDIYKKSFGDNECQYYLVLTPSCDLANKKAEEVILCKIRKFDEIEQFRKALDDFSQVCQKDGRKAKNAKETLSKWFRNSHSESARYHFLPKTKNFEGGFVDFRSLISLEYDKEKGEIKATDYEKIGVITEAFKRNIISRFSSYYHRQGQPDFNNDSILKYFE